MIFAAAAARTSRLRMGPEVTNIILKEPTIIAQQAATLDELTGGRAELVFSTGNFAMLKQYRVNLDGMKPIRRLRDLFGWGVIYALHGRACIERGRVWQAEH